MEVTDQLPGEAIGVSEFQHCMPEGRYLFVIFGPM